MGVCAAVCSCFAVAVSGRRREPWRWRASHWPAALGPCLHYYSPHILLLLHHHRLPRPIRLLSLPWWEAYTPPRVLLSRIATVTSEVEKENRRRRVRESQEEEIMQEDKGYMIVCEGGEASSRWRRWLCFPPSVPIVLLHTPSALESVRSELIPCALYFLSFNLI